MKAIPGNGSVQENHHVYTLNTKGMGEAWLPPNAQGNEVVIRDPMYKFDTKPVLNRAGISRKCLLFPFFRPDFKNP